MGVWWWAVGLRSQLFGIPDDENDVTPDTNDKEAGALKLYTHVALALCACCATYMLRAHDDVVSCHAHDVSLPAQSVHGASSVQPQPLNCGLTQRAQACWCIRMPRMTQRAQACWCIRMLVYTYATNDTTRTCMMVYTYAGVYECYAGGESAAATDSAAAAEPKKRETLRDFAEQNSYNAATLFTKVAQLSCM